MLTGLLIHLTKKVYMVRFKIGGRKKFCILKQEESEVPWQMALIQEGIMIFCTTMSFSLSINHFAVYHKLTTFVTQTGLRINV